MIVLCPSCQTRYRHPPIPDTATPDAQCSHCDETFPLTGSPRSYVLLPLAARAKHVPVGVDDPALAERVGIEVPPAPVEDPRDLLPLPDRAEDLGEDLAEAAPAEATVEPTPEPTHRPSGLLQTGVALLPAAIGAGLAYHLSSREAVDQVAWTALGGAIGLLVGWCGLLWMRRED